MYNIIFDFFIIKAAISNNKSEIYMYFTDFIHKIKFYIKLQMEQVLSARINFILQLKSNLLKFYKYFQNE